MILLGVSRCGKTPTSLYLAMQFGIRAANYPFIADDMDNLVLPAALKPLQHKLFGLTINPERLAAIREERRENSRYASMRQCRMEVSEVEALYRKNQIPCAAARTKTDVPSRQVSCHSAGPYTEWDTEVQTAEPPRCP